MAGNEGRRILAETVMLESFPEPFKETSETLQICLGGMPCRNTLQEFPSGSLAGTFRETMTKLVDVV